MQKSYRQYIILNKNLILAFIVAITVSALVAQSLSDHASYVNSSYTVVVDFVVFYSTFSFLFYFDNRKKYRDESGKLEKARLKKDLIKIVSSLGVAEIVYTAARWALQFYFLNLGYDAYLASIIAHVISTILYMIVVNLSVKITRLYKNGT
ncbi:MAG: hypothetical protein ACT4OD_04195 [Candidatus Nitrosotenuis sp.]